jgi:hypothetical protein
MRRIEATRIDEDNVVAIAAQSRRQDTFDTAKQAMAVGKRDIDAGLLCAENVVLQVGEPDTLICRRCKLRRDVT